MIQFDDIVLAGSFRIMVPADIGVRIFIDTNGIGVSIDPNSPKGERFAYRATDEEKADFLSTVLGRVYGLPNKDFSLYRAALEKRTLRHKQHESTHIQGRQSKAEGSGQPRHNMPEAAPCSGPFPTGGPNCDAAAPEPQKPAQCQALLLLDASVQAQEHSDLSPHCRALQDALNRQGYSDVRIIRVSPYKAQASGCIARWFEGLL